MTKNQKLELTWIDKDVQPRLETRILIEDPDKYDGDR
jgi:adenine-specific DNA-methyltransferase